MKNNIFFALVLISFALSATFFLTKPEVKDPSFSGFENPYKYTNISSTNASSTAGVQVRGGAGVLGSITINTTHATVIRVYDGLTATSTGTLIASIKASTAEQTLNYDVAVTKGIILDVPAGYAGNLTVASH